MARAKVRPDHAERVLNHKISGIEGTYDRHNYEDEKREALAQLEQLLRQIVDGEQERRNANLKRGVAAAIGNNRLGSEIFLTFAETGRVAFAIGVDFDVHQPATR